jgi:RNA polymerase sigma-70 factor (ECF subfamily)
VNEETRQLIISAQEGDDVAFHKIVAMYDERIMLLALQITQNQQDAEDVYQETFIKTYKNLKKFRFESEIYTWMYRIAVNTAYNFKRKQSKIQLVEPTQSDDRDRVDQIPETNPADDSTKEFNKAVRESLHLLPRQQRTVFILKHLQNLKIKDIANILNISDGTVKKYLFRAVEKLQVALKEYNYVQ